MRKALAPAELGFNQRDRRRLTQALREEADPRALRRLQAVLLVAEGQDMAASAHLTGFSPRSLYRFVNRYLDARQAGVLCDQQRAGRPAVAPQLSAARVLRELQRVPRHCGYRTNVWTVELLAVRLNERYACSISPRTLRRRMKQIGLRCKRPRYVYSEKEPHVAQKKGRLCGG